MSSTHFVSFPLLVYILFVLLFELEPVYAGGGKVLDLNERLPEFVEKYADKSWLVKFYAPWCYHCQQLEPIYNNIAERIYREQSDLIVGRVDCTKHGHICETYGVDSYPTIIHVKRDSNSKYRGDRSEESIISFARRLQLPDVNVVHDCDRLREATNEHGIVVLCTISNPNNDLRRQFESLAKVHKSNYWFYQYIGTCADFIQDEGIYLLKEHMNKPLRFPDLKDYQTDKIEQTLTDWLNKESFPIYTQVSHRNIERLLNSRELLAVAILDEYKPARRFSKTSHEFHKRFEKFAHNYTQHDDQIRFGWSSDIELIEYITIGPITLPNVIVLKPDFSYLLLEDGVNKTQSDDTSNDEDLDKLCESNIRSLITAAKGGKLVFKGGSGYIYVILRHIFGSFNKFMTMYRANPLLVSLIFGFPSLIVIFVIYTTCFDANPDSSEEGEYSDEEDEYNDLDGERHRLVRHGHLKQD